MAKDYSQNLDTFRADFEYQLSLKDVWYDYYLGGGRQWWIKGQMTRSGRYMVDKVISSQSQGYYNLRKVL